jgi:2-enoate reductase
LPPAAGKPLRIAVVGAGPAGVTAAVTAARRGHKVDLIERGSRIGGRLLPGSTAKIKYEVDNYRRYLETLVERTAAGGNLTLSLNGAADVERLKAGNYDRIVFALGTRDLTPPLPGVEEANAVQAAELLLNPERLGQARKVVVVGGGIVGCEAAYWLRYEKDCEVTVVEMDKYIMNHTCTANRGHLIHYLRKAGVSLLNCTRVTGFTRDGVKVARNVSKTVPDPFITWHPILPENVENPLAPKLKVDERQETLPADLVVLAVGGAPDDALYFAALREQAAAELYNIGDSFSGGKVLEAVRAAYRLGLCL